MSLQNLPIGLFGAVMGLAGLGLTARATATVLPGLLRAPAYFTELWVALGALVFLVVTPLYLVKLFLELHQATIELESELGVGTKATVRFPRERSLRDQAA